MSGIAVDTASLKAAVFARLKSDTTGAGARAKLGGAASVVLVGQLGALAHTTARPLAALRAMPVVRREHVLTLAVFDWLLYDDKAQQYRRIDEAAYAIQLAYHAAPLAAPTLAINKIDIEQQQDAEDTALGLLYRVLRISIYA